VWRRKLNVTPNFVSLVEFSVVGAYLYTLLLPETSGQLSRTIDISMPLAKPIRADRRKRHAANARDRVVKLKGDIFHSTAILCEFLYYAFNTILGLREVYPKHDFKWDKRYDIYLPMLIDTDLKGYLTKVTTQLKRWSPFRCHPTSC